MQKITFKELYKKELDKPTQAQKWIHEVAEVTGVAESTVRMWLSGKQQPNVSAKATLAKHFKVDADTLFSNN